MENRQSEVSNVEMDKAADETEENALQGEKMAERQKSMLLHVQSNRLFQVSLE
jgi:hypothetical protein